MDLVIVIFITIFKNAQQMRQFEKKLFGTPIIQLFVLHILFTGTYYRIGFGKKIILLLPLIIKSPFIYAIAYVVGNRKVA